MKKFLGFIDRRPLIWFHYLLLVGVVILGYYISRWIKLMDLIQSSNLFFKILGWISLILLYYFLLLIFDNIIHKILGVD